jgi:hypothetical protein
MHDQKWITHHPAQFMHDQKWITHHPAQFMHDQKWITHHSTHFMSDQRCITHYQSQISFHQSFGVFLNHRKNSSFKGLERLSDFSSEFRSKVLRLWELETPKLDQLH